MNTADFLSRQPYLDLLKSIISNQCNNSTGYAFAIDGKWGSGKTWIITELENQLVEDTKNKYLIFHYNAWENDFYEEPLVALLSVMIEKLNKVTSQESLYEAAVDELLRQVSADLLSVVSGTVKKITAIDIEAIFKRKKGFIKRIQQSTKLQANVINALIPLQNTLKKIRDNILKLSEKLYIILIVDELDRCLPEYAIKVLERLHHVCNEMPVVQILAINKQNLADSIAKVFGKDFPNDPKRIILCSQFAESYLQKFVDVIVPLPIGTIDKRLDVLDALEKSYSPYINKTLTGLDFINLNDDFLADFISTLMNGIERRLQEKIFKQVELCHKLTINSGIAYEKEQMTYAILIYEIISCICRYVFHINGICKFSHERDTGFSLKFFVSEGSSLDPYEREHEILNRNIKSFFLCPEQYSNGTNGTHPLPFKITDTKSYIMAFFVPNSNHDLGASERHIVDCIRKDKTFLQKYDEIMDMLVAK